MVEKIMWQRTPEGRATISKIAKKRWKENREAMMRGIKKNAANRKRKEKEVNKLLPKEETGNEQAREDETSEKKIIYALGWIESWISVYASRADIPQSIIARRLGELLLGTKRRG